jgi:hypothetical protein
MLHQRGEKRQAAQLVRFTMRHHAGLAQLVEQLICNQYVAGSNPASGTDNIKLLVGRSGTKGIV